MASNSEEFCITLPDLLSSPLAEFIREVPVVVQKRPTYSLLATNIGSASIFEKKTSTPTQ